MISKTKIFFATQDEETKKWSKKDIDRLGKPFPWYLPYEVEFEDGVRVRDFLNLLKKHEVHVNLVFCGYLGDAKLADFLAELDHKPDPESATEIEVVEFFWDVELEPLTESEFEELAEFKIMKRPSIRGISAGSEEEADDNIIFENEFDLAIIALRNFADKHISINKYVEYAAFDDIAEPMPNILLDGEMDWTLMDIISAFLTEISYYGTPEDQKVIHDEIMKEAIEMENSQEVIEHDDLIAYLDSINDRI